MTGTATINGTTVDSAEKASFIERIAEKMGAIARSALVYGEPVERDGVTVIPVARVRYGFGGGAGEGEGGPGNQGHGSGSGGGGAVDAGPAGYIEIRNGTSTFRPIYSPTSLAILILAGSAAGMLVMRGIAALKEQRENVDTETHYQA